MPLYDCGDPDCSECQREFGPDRSKAIAANEQRAHAYDRIGRINAANRGKVITSFVYPPIPYRGADWQAHFDDDEPNDEGQMLCGRGATETEAIDDLLDNFEAGI